LAFFEAVLRVADELKQNKEVNMKNYSIVSSINAVFLYIFVLLCFTISGCAGVGSTIPQERRVSLTETENNQGNLKYGSLSVKYSYSLVGGNLISAGGNMILAGKISYRDRFDSLDVRILFLDAAGTVLQKEFVYSSGYRTRDKSSNSAFQKTFTVPAGSVAMTFTYSAQDHTGHR
jgi:hypothetical protein